MDVLKQDLERLEGLDESEVPMIFWLATKPGGAEELARRIKTQYMELMSRIQVGERHELGRLVKRAVVLGAVRGLGWGLMLERKRKEIPDDEIASRILRHKAVQKLLIQKNPIKSAEEICKALDERSVELPGTWADLQKKSAWWEPHHEEKKVMNAIRRARDRAIQEEEDVEYLKAAVIAAKDAAKAKAVAARKEAAERESKQPNLFQKDKDKEPA